SRAFIFLILSEFLQSFHLAPAKKPPFACWSDAPALPAQGRRHRDLPLSLRAAPFRKLAVDGGAVHVPGAARGALPAGGEPAACQRRGGRLVDFQQGLRREVRNVVRDLGEP